MYRLFDAIVAIFLITVIILSFSTLTKAETQTNLVEPRVVQIPTLCGPAKELFGSMKTNKYKPVIVNEANQRTFVVFINKDKNVVVTVTVGPLTCILADEESADIDLKSLFEEM